MYDETKTSHKTGAHSPTSLLVVDEEAFEVREETQPILRSAQLVLHNVPQPLLQPILQLRPPTEFEPVELISDIAPWIPHRVNQYTSDYPEQSICLEDLVTVAFRVSECNRIRSIEATYDNDTATAKCVAIRNTHFHIMLFHGETERHIIVKMRRMSGCALIFQEEYRAIMNAAKFGEISRRKVLPTLDEPCKNDDFIPLQDSILEKNLTSMKIYLHSDRHDTRVLALEDLASTTNSDLSFDDTALKASKIIMEQNSGIRESVASIILTKEVCAFDDKYIRSLALTTLSNILSTLSKEKILTPFIQDKWYTLSLIPSLIDEIKTASKYPRNASLAAKCLSELFANSAEARSQAGDDTLIALEAAKKVGESSYASLEEEAQVAIDKMVQQHN